MAPRGRLKHWKCADLWLMWMPILRVHSHFMVRDRREGSLHGLSQGEGELVVFRESCKSRLCAHLVVGRPPCFRALLISWQSHFLSKPLERQIFLPCGGLTKGGRLGTHERS